MVPVDAAACPIEIRARNHSQVLRVCQDAALKGEMPTWKPMLGTPKAAKGKHNCENKLRMLGIPWCSFRPTYITGPQNYNPVERYFLERVDAHLRFRSPGSREAGQAPGHGQHLTGLGHFEVRC
jgi:hypothetical protein